MPFPISHLTVAVIQRHGDKLGLIQGTINECYWGPQCSLLTSDSDSNGDWEADPKLAARLSLRQATRYLTRAGRPLDTYTSLLFVPLEELNL